MSNDLNPTQTNLSDELLKLDLQLGCFHSELREVTGLSSIEKDNLNSYILRAKESFIKIQSYIHNLNIK